MDTKQPLSLFLVAILVASVFTVVGLTSMPLRNVSAQDVTIETSVDELGGTFFGHGAIQVVIEDENADDDGADTIDVDIEVEGESDSFTIPNTSVGSQRFEFFLVHEDSLINGAAFLDGIAAAPTIITFGTGGDLDTADDLFVDAAIEINYENEQVNIDYEEVPAILSLDREVFGSTSIVYVRINDQDANINPTETDAFTLDDTELNDELFVVSGGAFNTTDLTFEETGTNTGVFEAEVTLEDTAPADDEFDFDEETIQMTVNDQANYNTTLTFSNGTAIPINDPEINGSTDTSDVTFEIDDSDGDVDDIGVLTFGTELVVTVRDDDQNRDSEDEDDIDGALVVESNGGFGAGGDTEEVDLTETGDNTGVFEIDLSNGELRFTFLDDASTPTANNGILEFNVADIEEDITISYVDPLSDAGIEEEVALFTVELDVTPGQLAAPEEVGVTDEFTVTLTDADLNDNPRTRDSYTIELDGDGPFPLMRGGLDFSDMYEFEIEHDGDVLDFGPFGALGGSNVTITMTETGVNTGIFEFEIDMEDITEFGDGGDPLDVSDGDEIQVNIDDFMADATDADEDDVSITIGKPNVGLDFDRTSVPIPPEDDSSAADPAVGLGDEVIVRLILVDPTLATNSNVEEFIDPFPFGAGENEFTIEVDGDDVDSCGPVVDPALCDIGVVDLDDIMDIDALEETGENTGVFEAEITFFDFAGFDTGDLQDAEVIFTYTNDEGDEESAGFTFRGSDGVITVDQNSATAGSIITVIVEDQDLNLDSDEMDSFESSLAAAEPFLVGVESEDDDIAGGDTQTFEETGEDTGIFSAEFEVGEDILIVDVGAGDQASNILFTYNDEIDSTGGGGDELEVNVPVVSSTGSIQVTPELVGPATTLTILIVDSDLDDDANSVDEYTEADVGDMVEFASSRNEVDEAVPDIEETGPNTGVFMFELELITDAAACADDDLGTAEFEATGGDTDSTIGACPGDLISIRYEDEVTGSGGGSTVSEVVEVRSWDPEFVADQDSYGIGDRVTVSISDPDANRDPDIADSLTDIRVTSDSDRVGEEFSAIETGRDTGVFRLTFGTTSGTAGGSISVSQGDEITVRYTDEFPADFVDEEEDKDFEFTVSVGGASSAGATTVTPPAPQSPTGQELDEVSAGQQVVLTTSVRNNNASPQDFVALIEVRDSSGITVFLAWQTGTLPASGQTQVGLSWTPEFTDDYTVRTFVISDLNNPQVLSAIAESEITVS